MHLITYTIDPTHLATQKFRLYVLDSDRATDVLAYLLCYGIEIKDKPRTFLQWILLWCKLTSHPEQHGLCRTISYIIQSISAERTFGQKLSSPIKAQLPQKWSNLGTAADFMIHVRVVCA